jgi:hypothetical protein
MKTIDFIFTSDRFNVSERKEYFINDRCYGDDLARWLVERLRSQGLIASEPCQEDWGWCFDVRSEKISYFIGVGVMDNEEPPPNSQVQWRVFVEKRRGFWEMLKRSNPFSETDGLIEILKQILASEPGMVLLGIE